MIPTAALRRLIATRTGQGTTPTQRDRASWNRCPRCHAWTLTGLDNPIMALAVRADPTPLDRRGEAIALLAGRGTYRLHLTPTAQLRRRDHWQILGDPADPTDCLVLPDHVCGQPLAPAIDKLTRHTTTGGTHEPCPY